MSLIPHPGPSINNNLNGWNFFPRNIPIAIIISVLLDQSPHLLLSDQMTALINMQQHALLRQQNTQLIQSLLFGSSRCDGLCAVGGMDRHKKVDGEGDKHVHCDRGNHDPEEEVEERATRKRRHALLHGHGEVLCINIILERED